MMQAQHYTHQHFNKLVNFSNQQRTGQLTMMTTISPSVGWLPISEAGGKTDLPYCLPVNVVTGTKHEVGGSWEDGMEQGRWEGCRSDVFRIW